MTPSTSTLDRHKYQLRRGQDRTLLMGRLIYQRIASSWNYLDEDTAIAPKVDEIKELT